MEQKKPRKRKAKAQKAPEEGAAIPVEQGAAQEATEGVKETKADTQTPIVPEVVKEEEEKKREQERTRIKKKLFLEALRKAAGDIQAACELADVGRSTFYEWRTDDSEFRTNLDKVETELMDDVESVVYRQIRQGDGMLAYRWLQSRHPKYKPTLKTEVVHGTRTLEDIIYEMAERRRAIAEGRDPNTVQGETKEIEDGKEQTP